jgi:hypothetical protein
MDDFNSYNIWLSNDPMASIITASFRGPYGKLEMICVSREESGRAC